MGADFINGLGSRSSLICAVPGAEARGLSPEEQRLVVCAGAGATVGEVIAASGFSEARAIALLLGLRLRGIVQPGGVRRTMPMSPQAGRPPNLATGSAVTSSFSARAREKTAGPVPADGAPLGEEVDLEAERMKEILELDQRCVGDDLFAVLGVPAGASAPEVKKAYYELSKRFHPDRFFGKNLGSYKARIDRIFRRLTEAQAVLTEPGRRQGYLAQHPELAAVATGVVELDPARAAERRARLLRHPYLAKAAKLHELTERGRAQLHKGEYARAFTDLSLASQIDPRNKEVTELLQAAKQGGDRVRAESEFRDGELAVKMGDYPEALRRMRNAAQLDPDNADYAARAARLILSNGGAAEIKEAHGLARRASELKPQDADLRLLFASVLLKAGLDKNAQREFETVLKLRPEDLVAKENLKKLRWRF